MLLLQKMSTKLIDPHHHIYPLVTGLLTYCQDRHQVPWLALYCLQFYGKLIILNPLEPQQPLLRNSHNATIDNLKQVTMHSGNDFDFSKCLLKLLQHFDCGLLFLETIREHVVTFGLILIKCCSHGSGLCLSIVMFSISISTQVEFYVFMTCRLDILPPRNCHRLLQRKTL